MTSLTGIENWPCLLRHVLGGAGWMALLEYGGADGLDLQLSRVLAGGFGAPTYQEGDNGPAFLGVVLGGLLAGVKRDMDGELGMNWEDI